MRLTIDGAELSAREGSSVLEVALENDIYVPHLCSHPDLAPYGGCRMCLVEVEGMRGCPPACTTQAREGMVVYTRTDAVLTMRREILQLILSEHPSSCLICPESAECTSYQGTIRKVGVTTGCRYCPKDGVCELQAVARSLGVTELTLPNIYRDQPVENGEEFYDRDYNLCIFCARCVRVCQEHRQAAVLSLRQRGPLTTIGPAFEMSHYEAGCEFCGACVSVCPTGALSEKGRKWAGAAERLAPSVCMLCSQQCDIQAEVVKDHVVGTLPPGDPRIAGGELCVKGRFCLADLANHPDRLRVPTVQTADGCEDVDWERATAAVAEKLNGIPGNRVAIYVSPALLLEDLVTLRRLADKVLHTDHVTTTAIEPGSGELLGRSFASPGLDALSSSDCIVSLFFNGNYGYAPATLAIKRAANKGARYFQVGWLTDPTSRFATRHITPTPGQEAALMRNLVKAVSEHASDDADLSELAEALHAAGRTTFLLGMGIAHLPQAAELLEAIDKMVEQKRAVVVTPHPHGNLLGLLTALRPKPREDVELLVRDGKIDALWIIGESPFEKRPPVNVVIYQNTFPPPEELAADIVLPSASWCEVTGSLAAPDEQWRLKAMHAAVQPPGLARQDWKIFAEIAKAMGAQTIGPPSAHDVNALAKDAEKAAAALLVDGHAHTAPPAAEEGARYVLVRETDPHRFRGLSLADYIEDMARLAPEEALFLNPLDAEELGVQEGDSLTISVDGQSQPYPVHLDRKVAPALLYLLSSSGGEIVRPVRVEVR
jgi:NADH dehydrogenase/NADH:ubiquinone oxidoreductase subunit G